MGRQFIDLMGRVFGRLTVIKFVGTNNQGASMWECLCSCGNPKVTLGVSLRAGKTCSCGCFHRDTVGKTHGLSKTREYKKWSSAKWRCKPDAPCHQDYYDRGIKMYPPWEKDFTKFLAHIGPCPPNMELDRKDNSKGYIPGNVRWVPNITQNANRRNSRYLTIDGKTLHVSEWSRISGVHVQTILSRLRAGKTPEESIHRGLRLAM